MKKVRLFAVAAAMGMFATTVAAADTSKTTVTWGKYEEIIKVDLGEKLIVGTPSVGISIETESTICQNGTDTNGDGYVDTQILTLLPSLNSGWMFTNAKYWNSEKDAMMHLGLGNGSITGGRFLAPNQAENEGTYIAQLQNKHFTNEEAVIKFLVDEGAIKINYDEDDYIKTVEVQTNNVTYTNKKFNYAESLVITSNGSRKSDDAIINAVIDYYVNDTAIPTSTLYETSYTKKSTYNTATMPGVKLVDGDVDLNVSLTEQQIKDGAIVIVSTDRKGNYIYEDITSYEAKNINVATGGDLTIASDLNANAIYKIKDSNGEEFKEADITTLIKDSGVTAYNEKYAYATNSDVLDAIVYTSNDNGANTNVKNLVSYKTADIYYQETNGNLTKITDKNYTTLFTNNNLDRLYVGTSKLSSFTSYNGVVELRTPYDFVDYKTNALAPQGYYKATRGYDSFTVGGEYAYSKDQAFQITEQTSNTEYDHITKLGAKNKVTVVDISDAEGTNNVGAYRVTSFTPTKKSMYDVTGDYVLNIEDMTFNFNENATTIDSDDLTTTFSSTENGYGLFYLETPKNTSNYYVLYNGPTSNLDLEFSVNTAKETIYADAANGDELTAKAVKLDGKWYPAFETEKELTEFVIALTGITSHKGSSTDKTSDFYKWYSAALNDTKVSTMGSEVYNATLPTDAISNPGQGTSCDYKVSTPVDSSKIKVEHDASKIDTNKAGVYDVTYTAYVDDKEVATTTSKIVVAPKYVRTWENGKVKSLTSYYVTNPTAKYAEYNYNWTNKTVTVTYYNIDGTVADTTTNSL